MTIKMQPACEPTKCSFGVTPRKHLGYVVNSRGFKAGPLNVKVITKMWPPMMEKLI